MGNIQPEERHNSNRAADIVSAVIPGLVIADEHAHDEIGKVVGSMRITAAPRHPGRDPVSVHIVEEVASVLRGEDGLAHRLGAVMERLRTSVGQLDGSRRAYQVTDQDAVDTFERTLDEDRR